MPSCAGRTAAASCSAAPATTPPRATASPRALGVVYVVTADVDALHDRAVAAGAEIVVALHDTDYGSRDFTARDPEGARWSFGTYAGHTPGVNRGGVRG